MTLTQVRYLVAIVDAGLNITLAAERVHATQPGLSKQLKQLEEQLGFLLFSRRGRSLDAITPAGQQVIVHARRILAETANIGVYAANQRDDREGSLVLATTHTQARFVLPAAISQVRTLYPRLSIHLEPSSEGDVLALLASGEADAALISTAGETPAGGIAIPLFRWRRIVLVPKDHPLASGDIADIHDLASHRLVAYESTRRPESSLRRAFAEAGHVPNLAMTATDADLIKTYVRAGMGVGVLAEMAVDSVADADLHAMTAPASIPECVAWAVLPGERVLRNYTLELLHAIAPQLDRHDLRRMLAGNVEIQWPKAPHWRELSQTITQ